MNITQRLVGKVRAHERNSWHDQNWWNFDNLPEVEAIVFAIENLPRGTTRAQIVIEAKRYLGNFDQ